MKDLLEYIVQNLVTKPEAISIDEQNDGGSVNLTLTVDPSDMGIIIGKNGQTIRAIRKLLTVRAIAENVRINLQLAEPEGGIPAAAQDETPIEETVTEEAPAEEIPQESEPKNEAAQVDEPAKE